MKLRQAYPRDGEGIREIVNTYASQGLMLPRSLSSIYENIRDFRVIAGGDRIMGCAALQVYWEDIAEIRSLAVIEEIQGEGWGRALVDDCLREARALKLPRVFTLTFTPPFFKKFGFSEIEKEKLPHKIWKDCIHCPHFPDCKEVALIRDL
ncbi:MAG: N-acetyltransferase [Candidatus Euphemobacter frigidus]|nr:N-acetyltransferase [Candidatus Euphemobacter frigidus]MDP8274856.1 N-acetyltransferase [Candidatus Euphemobacter frigidus]